jgi:hypothetical protein
MQLRQASLTWHVAGDEVVVLDLDGSVYLKLNGSARDLNAALVDTFEVDETRAAQDVAAFLTELRSRGLLEA